MAVGECAFPLCRPRRSPSSLWEQRLHFSRLLSHRATVCVSAAHAPARARARPLSRLRSSRGGRWRFFFFSIYVFDTLFLLKYTSVCIFFRSVAFDVLQKILWSFSAQTVADFRGPSADESARKRGTSALAETTTAAGGRR